MASHRPWVCWSRVLRNKKRKRCTHTGTALFHQIGYDVFFDFREQHVSKLPDNATLWIFRRCAGAGPAIAARHPRRRRCRQPINPRGVPELRAELTAAETRSFPLRRRRSEVYLLLKGCAPNLFVRHGRQYAGRCWKAGKRRQIRVMVPRGC